MSTLERRLDLINGTIQNRLALGRSAELNSIGTPFKREIAVNSNFISEKLSELKNTNVISFEGFKVKRLVIAENNLKTNLPDPSIEISNVSDHPNRKLLNKLDRVNGVMRRFRRGGRCRAAGQHEYGKCGTGSRCHMKEGVNTKSTQAEKPIVATSRKSRKRNNLRLVA